jgi:hypothetical protein
LDYPAGNRWLKPTAMMFPMDLSNALAIAGIIFDSKMWLHPCVSCCQHPLTDAGSNVISVGFIQRLDGHDLNRL